VWGRSITLFRLLGFEVKVDLSWVVIAALVTWSLASSVFPESLPSQQPAFYWLMGIIGAVGLFASIVFHEFSHSLIARMQGLNMRGITLFIFGGVAEMTEQPASPRVEFLMSIVGPLSSLVLSGVFYLVSLLPLPDAPTIVLRWLGSINVILAVFNMIPAFPLDGGRVLRSALWAIKKDLRWATRIASLFGSGFGILLILVGLVNFFYGNFIGGLWLALIGMFIRGASQVSWQQVLMRRSLEGERIDRFMQPEPVTVSPSLSIRQAVENYFYRYHAGMFPVVRDSMLLGCITAGGIRSVPQDQWDAATVSRVIEPCTPENSMAPHADALDALNLMNRTGNSRIMVVDGERLAGIITLEDMLAFLGMKLDLEGRSK
jgi:Zn-dependent protease/CBS domain-containing protein